jgi:hypothetical protein
LFRYLLLFIIITYSAKSQAIFEPIYFVQDSSYIITGTNKFQNIYNFSDEIFVTQNGEYGRFYVLQNYYGQGTPLANSSSFQETQKLRLNYEYEVTSDLFFVNKNNWFISSNTLNFGQNKLERLNFLLGSKYSFLQNSFMEGGYGKERNTTVGIETIGDYYYANYSVSNLELEDLYINSQGFADIVNLDDGRVNKDINFRLSALKSFDERSSIFFDIGLLNRNRDNPEINPGLVDIPIRRRQSDKIQMSTSLNFYLSDKISNIISIGLNNELISNNYLSSYNSINESNFKREVDIYNFDISNTLNYRAIDFNLFSYINYNRTNEDYSALNILNLPANQFEIYRNDQNRQDRVESYFNMKLNSFINLSNKDSLSIGTDYRLLRYDTPSDKNNDDRDELSLAGDIEYIRRVSNILSIGIRNEFRFFHYVYLKSQRSSSNNWNRIIKMAPTIIIKSNYFYYKPILGINANYTTYDFENIVTGINSFSFREVSYLDSIQIKLANQTFFETKNEMRYSERGILYWNVFAEQPQRSNFELFLRGIFIKRTEYYIVGCGLRYFKRKDIRISEFISQNNVILNDFESLAPELILEYIFDSGNSFKLDFWYEFQSINLIKKNELVNFYLSTNIKL